MKSGGYDGSHTLVLDNISSIICGNTKTNPWESEVFVIGDVGWKLKCYREGNKLYISLMGISDVADHFLRPSHIQISLKKHRFIGDITVIGKYPIHTAKVSYDLRLFEDPSLYVMDDSIVYVIHTKVIEKEENDYCFQTVGKNIKGSC